jgi:hydroxymethylpyrimidine pyrophosphatase-like HAD family hydrolase
VQPASNAGTATARRAVFLDYDGTYADHGVVPNGHVLAVRAARASGHRVFLCTGRPRSMIHPSVLAELDGFVAAAGGYVDVGGQLLADHRFPAELAARAVSLLDEHDVAYLLEAPEAVYGPPGVDRRLAALLRGRLRSSDHPDREGPRDILDALRMSDDLTGASFGKITCFDSPVPVSSIAQQIGPEIGALPSSIPDMGDSAGELYLSWIHKALGIQTVTDHLGIDRSQVVAVGDGLNDIEMLEFAGTAVAIQDSDPRVLTVADLVAPGPHQEGLVSLFVELELVGAPHIT